MRFLYNELSEIGMADRHDEAIVMIVHHQLPTIEQYATMFPSPDASRDNDPQLQVIDDANEDFALEMFYLHAEDMIQFFAGTDTESELCWRKHTFTSQRLVVGNMGAFPFPLTINR